MVVVVVVWVGGGGVVVVAKWCFWVGKEGEACRHACELSRQRSGQSVRVKDQTDDSPRGGLRVMDGQTNGHHQTS